MREVTEHIYCDICGKELTKDTQAEIYAVRLKVSSISLPKLYDVAAQDVCQACMFELVDAINKKARNTFKEVINE